MEELPVVEEAAPVEEPVIVEEVKEEPKVESAPVVEADSEFPYVAAVKPNINLSVTTGPSVFATKVNVLRPCTRVTIYEHIGNFGRIGSSKWVNINFIVKV